MDLCIERLQNDDRRYRYVPYAVHVDRNRILSIVTDSKVTAAKWVRNAMRSKRTLIIGISVERLFCSYGKKGLVDAPFSFIYICTGSHCLSYRLPEPNELRSCTFLKKFFSSPKVMVAGPNIEEIQSKLEKSFGILMKQTIDVSDPREGRIKEKHPNPSRLVMSEKKVMHGTRDAYLSLRMAQLQICPSKKNKEKEAV